MKDPRTPFVAVDRSRVRANIEAMQTLATKAGVRLRPHAKTHKSPVIARWQLDAGAVGICCAKLGEAEVFAAAGIPDIRLPYPINPSNADRVLALQQQTRLSIIVDDVEVAREWSALMITAGSRLDVLVKIDVGFHRCGMDPDSATVVDRIRQIADLSGLRLLGLLSHAGHGYSAGSVAELRAIAEREALILNSLAARLRDVAVPIDEISVGATPTARFIELQKGVTEMRPGNYVFFDRTQAGLEATLLDHCALSVMATVVSRPVPNRLIVDAGAKVLSTDAVRGFGQPGGYGLVYPSVDATVPDPSIVIERLSEEHGVARVPTSCALRIGDRVRIIPNHACVVTNLVDEIVVVGGDRGVERMPVAARGRTS